MGHRSLKRADQKEARPSPVSQRPPTSKKWQHSASPSPGRSHSKKVERKSRCCKRTNRRRHHSSSSPSSPSSSSSSLSSSSSSSSSSSEEEQSPPRKARKHPLPSEADTELDYEEAPTEDGPPPVKSLELDMKRLHQELEAVIESRMGKVRDQLKGSSEAIFAQAKQQVNTNHNLADIAKNLGNLGDKMKPTNPQTPVATTLSSLHHLMKEIRSDMQTRTNERARQERQWTQHMEDTRRLTTSVDALTKEIKGHNEIMTTFLLVLTSRTMPDGAIVPHAETLKKMCGVTDGVWDDENDKVETGEDRRDPYPHFKTPLDKTASRPPRGLSHCQEAWPLASFQVTGILKIPEVTITRPPCNVPPIQPPTLPKATQLSTTVTGTALTFSR